MWLFQDKKGEPLCNFIPQVVAVNEVCSDGAGKPAPHAQIYFNFGEDDTEQSQVYSVPLSEIDKTNWKELNERCIYHPEKTGSKVNRYLSCTIREALEAAPKNRVYCLTHVGMYKIEGRPVFCTGNQVIQSSRTTLNGKFEIKSVEQKLDVNNKLTEVEAASEIFKYICLSPNSGQVMLAYKLGFFMRLAYVDAGRPPKGCIFLYGRTGIQKTTFSSFLNQTYNRGEGIKSLPRLDASIPAVIRILAEHSNDVVILDDLCPADSSKIRGQMEEVLIETARYIADGTIPARMRGKQLSQETPQCGVIFTGEYVIGKGSDAARILPVEMTQPDRIKLKYFQDHPINISTFYYYFISWFIECYDEVCDILKKMWEKYESVDSGVHDRLREMHYFLSTAYYFFLQYCFEKELLLKADAVRLYNSFCNLLTILIQQQDRRVRQKEPETSKSQNYWGRIRELYRNNCFFIANDIEQFNVMKHDGLLHRNKFYIRSEKLSAYFPDADIDEIVSSLTEQGVLETGNGSRTKQISSLNGMRFYVIPLVNLN